MQVTDENGDTWTLNKGDPGHPAASYLKRLGYERVMLPLRQILQSGTPNARHTPSSTRLQAIDVMEDTNRYIAYASLLDQWTALEQAGLHVVG